MQYFSMKVMELVEQNYIEVIKYLTDIDVSNIINGEQDNTIIEQTKQNITNKIKNMNEEELNSKMKQIVQRLQSYYLPKLYKLEKKY